MNRRLYVAVIETCMAYGKVFLMKPMPDSDWQTFMWQVSC